MGVLEVANGRVQRPAFAPAGVRIAVAIADLATIPWHHDRTIGVPARSVGAWQPSIRGTRAVSLSDRTRKIDGVATASREYPQGGESFVHWCSLLRVGLLTNGE